MVAKIHGSGGGGHGKVESGGAGERRGVLVAGVVRKHRQHMFTRTYVRNDKMLVKACGLIVALGESFPERTM